MKSIFSYFIVQTIDDRYLTCFGIEKEKDNFFLYSQFWKNDEEHLICDPIPASSVISIVQYTKIDKESTECDITNSFNDEK